MSLAFCRKLSRQDLTRGFLVEPAQVRLPANSNDAREYVAELRRHVHEAECRDGGPELDAVSHADWESLLEALPCFLESGARKEGMHAEEVGIEDGGEAELLDDNFGQDGEEFGWVVEVVVKEHEPVFELVFLVFTFLNCSVVCRLMTGEYGLTNYRTECSILRQQSSVAPFATGHIHLHGLSLFYPRPPTP